MRTARHRATLSPPDKLRSFLATALIVLLAAPAAATAACTPAEALDFSRGASDALRCKSKELKKGSTLTCPAYVPPSCATQAYDAVSEIFFLDDPTPVLDGTTFADQIRCQQKLLTDAARFIKARTRDRLLDRRRQRTSSFRQSSRRCSLAIPTGALGETLPALGGECGFATPPGSTVEGNAIAECARPAVERALNDVLPGGALRPNIILIVADDQRADALGFMPVTMDRLGDRGLWFSNAFATTPLCGPSRVSFFTGQYSHNHGVPGNNLELFDETTSFAPRIQAAGYRTALIGKYMNNYDAVPEHIPPGWDEWRAFVSSGGSFFDYTMNENGKLVEYGSADKDYSTDVIKDMSLDFIKKNRNEPFLLYLNPAAPHGPNIPAPRHLGVFDGLPLHRPPNWHEPDTSDKPPLVNFFKTIYNPANLPARDERRIRMLESMLSVDEAIDEILDALDKHGLTDNTLVIYTSDHGYGWGEHWIQGKSFPYEEMIRIPFVVRYPVHDPAPGTIDDLVANIDVAPTLTDVAQSASTDDPDGQSLFELFAGDPWREEFVIEELANFFQNPWVGLRSESFKYVRIQTSSGGTFEELYDLNVDPYELDNVASAPAYQTTLSDLSDRLDEILP